MGGLGRRACARARRHLPGALLDRAGPARPGVRVALGALFAAALIAAGEWARHTEKLDGISGLPSAHIPSVLTAAGTTVAYADVYAAYALYGFLSPGAAFILLGLVALATLAAALLHGPALAGLGLIGAYVTPLLVSTARPNYWALYLYLAVVTAAAFALARFRLWRWLAISAVVLGALWTLPGLGAAGVAALEAHAFHVIAGFALAAALIVAGLLLGPDAEPGKIDGVSSGALGAYLIAACLLVLASRHDPIALVAFVVLVAATVAIAWRAEAAAAALPAAALLAALVIVRWALDLKVEQLLAPSGAGGRRRARAGQGRRRLASRARRGICRAVRRQRVLRARALATADRADAVERLRGVHAARHARGALLSHRQARALDPIRGRRAAAGRALCIRDRKARQARAASRAGGFSCGVRDRRGGRAGARAHDRARERLAHGRAGADGAGHRLGGGQAAAAGAALARGRDRRDRAGADRLGAAHRRP
jgi:hypothetical protein